MFLGSIISGLFFPVFFLDSPHQSKQSEAKVYVGSMNRAQQAIFIEKSAFATSVNALGIGIKTETTNYNYSVRATKKAGFNYGVSKEKKLKTYAGGVFVVSTKIFEPNTAKYEITTISILCELILPVQLNHRHQPMKMVKLLVVKGQ
jgi:type IV pilus assembly protein PilA